MQKFTLFITVLLCFFTGCAENSHKKTEKQTLRMSISRDPSTLDPRKGADLVTSIVHSLLFDKLTKIDEDRSLIPAISEKINLSDDKLVYTFHLKDTLWSDGTPLIAEDFASAWRTMLTPSFPCPNAHLFYAINNAEEVKKGVKDLSELGIYVLDDKTLEVHLKHPTPEFLEIIAFCALAPMKSSNKEKGISPESLEHFVCNGPFILKNWKHNHEIILSKNPYYWNQHTIKIDEIHISIIDNEMTALHMYENGELDLIASPLSPLPMDALKEYLSQGNYKTIHEPGSTVCFFNTEKFPFNNANIRKAFALSLNRQEIITNITQLNEIVATEIVPPILKQKSTTFYQDNDIQTALQCLQQGLRELGLSSPADLDNIAYCYANTEQHRKVAQAIQQQWLKALGIHVKLEQMEYKTLLDSLLRRNYTFGQGIWLAQYNDQMNILERFHSKGTVKNYSGWENQEYVSILERSNYANSKEEREEILKLAEAILADHMPISPIFHWNAILLTKPYLNIATCTPTEPRFYEKLSIDIERKRR